MSALLDGQIDEASHDFDRIKQEVTTRTAPMITKYLFMLLPNILWTNDPFQGCEYNKEKVLNIDVDKILGLKGNSEVN